MVNWIAILLYGALTHTLTFVLAAKAGSIWGMVLAVAATALTYVFQTGQELEINLPNWLLNWLWALIILLVVASWGLSVCA